MTICSVCGARVRTNQASEKCWRHRPRLQLQRSPLKPWRRPKKDRVSQELVDYLRARDGRCIVPTLIGWGWLRSSETNPCFGRMTVEHVRDQAAMGGKRAASRREYCVAACLGHIEWTKTHRAKELERRYLSVKEGAANDGGSAISVH